MPLPIGRLLLALALATLAGCGSGLPCQGDSLVCGGVCVEAKSDNLNCGVCGNACAAGLVCSGGACTVSCHAGLTDCSGSCVDTANHPAHCGACGNACAAGQVCSKGACALSCPAGLLVCGSACIDPMSNGSFCGSSDCTPGTHACAAGQVCSSGICALSCQAGLLNCNGKCVDPQSDRSYCGASDCTPGTHACAAGQVCSTGSCSISCQAGLVNCGGTCTDPQRDRNHCGAGSDCAASPGIVCAAGKVCSAGSCTTSCPGSEVACGGSCIDPQRDNTYCGASGTCTGGNIGTACASGLACAAGKCVPTCQAGQLVCNGRCIDPAVDATYCGATGDCAGPRAGVVCGPYDDCFNAACVTVAASLDLATPFSTDMTFPFASAVQPASLTPAPHLPTAFWNGRVAPLPTNTWWKYFAVGTGQQRVDAVPYQVKALPAGLAISVPAVQASASLVSVPDTQQFLFSSAEAFTGHVITAYDPLSVTLQYTASGGTMTLPVVMGMPYVTADYAGLTPHLLPGLIGLGQVNGATTTPVTGTRFQLTLTDSSTWILYSSASITFSWSVTGGMTASAPFTGTLRVANLPAGSIAAVLDAHAAAIPRSGTFQIGVGVDLARLQFSYATTGSGPLLTMAMPHHLARLRNPVLPGLSFGSLHGQLQAVEGSSWLLKIPLSPIGFQAPRPIAAARLTAVQAALASEKAFVPSATDPYFGGKELAKLARLAVIADEVGDAATAATLRANLDPLEAAWLEGTNSDPLRYDTTWGGVVSLNGLNSESADFGQGHYNDHHFHYGYHLYAAAVLIKANPAFAVTHRKGLLALVRDIANPSTSDPGFPQLRTFDIFSGHSWASGLRTALSESSTGNDQESSSEAVNAWYSLQMLGVAMGDQRMTDLGRLLLALEIDSARTYYQIPAASAIYPAVFAQNRCVGQLFSAQATFQTFFGTEPFKVYGIQLIPFTPASELLINPTWINDSWASKMNAAAIAAVANGQFAGFGGFLYLAHATIDKTAAWTEVNATGIDQGNSLTNSLWWVATRP